MQAGHSNGCIAEAGAGALVLSRRTQAVQSLIRVSVSLSNSVTLLFETDYAQVAFIHHSKDTQRGTWDERHPKGIQDHNAEPMVNSSFLILE